MKMFILIHLKQSKYDWHFNRIQIKQKAFYAKFSRIQCKLGQQEFEYILRVYIESCAREKIYDGRTMARRPCWHCLVPIYVILCDVCL